MPVGRSSRNKAIQAKEPDTLREPPPRINYCEMAPLFALGQPSAIPTLNIWLTQSQQSGICDSVFVFNGLRKGKRSPNNRKLLLPTPLYVPYRDPRMYIQISAHEWQAHPSDMRRRHNRHFDNILRISAWRLGWSFRRESCRPCPRYASGIRPGAGTTRWSLASGGRCSDRRGSRHQVRCRSAPLPRKG